MYSLEPLMMEGKTVQNTYSVIPKYNKFKNLIHLVGFTIEMLIKLYKDILYMECTNKLLVEYIHVHNIE